ncbi:MAG: glycosyltransferase [Rubrivivax sp.]|nr:glycosyltransferase [Rubrivivax sp.]
MTDLPRISIVTCSYEQGRFLDATLRSVLNQDYPDLEYIVMDGGSRDGSADVIRQHADRLSYWVSEPDGGQSDALSRGFARATGDIMGWLCSDDLLLPGALMSVGRFFARHPEVNVVYGDAVWIDEHGRPIRAKKEMGFNRFVFLFDHNYLPQPSVFWRRSVYERVGGLDRNFDLAMDSDLWERLSRVTRMVHIPGYWSCMRHYAAQKTQAQRPRGRREDETIRARAGRHRALAWALRPCARTVRIMTRIALGCYGAQVPAQLADALRSYEIPATPGTV